MIIRNIFAWLIDLIPGFDIPSNVFDSIKKIAQIGVFMDYYIPLDTFLLCMATFITVSIVCVVVSALLKLF